MIEFWVDNRIMIELLTTEMATQYLQFTTYPKTKKMFTAELVVAKV
ncbi:hypothetical protein FDUTEX481_06711 [Tolypothrix sp. PCC 7601]|nr:hypothetical protein FDUTEX481_06711 [Tolypothrix sp. PCC 7601]